MTIQGSKKKIAKYICPIIQQCINNNNIDTFIDAFVGGANIIKNIKCKNKIGIDNNPYLIALWKELQSPNFQFPEEAPSRKDWDRCKDGLETRDWYIGFVSIFGSNLTGGFPAGYESTHKRYNGRVRTCKKDLPFIKDINFICADYRQILNQYNNVVIYCDPPYDNARGYDYKKFNNEKFWDNMRELSKNNYVFVSETSAPDDFISIWSTEISTNLLAGGHNTRLEQLFIKKPI